MEHRQIERPLAPLQQRRAAHRGHVDNGAYRADKKTQQVYIFRELPQRTGSRKFLIRTPSRMVELLIE